MTCGVGSKLFQLWNSQEQTNTSYFLDYYKILICQTLLELKDRQSPNILENTNFDIKSILARSFKKYVGIKFWIAFIIWNITIENYCFKDCHRAQHCQRF